MARDFASLAAARAHSDAERIEREVLELPPSYKEGLRLIWKNNEQVSLLPGLVSVNGRRVQISEVRELEGEDWRTERVGKRFYWVYIAQGGEVYVDSVEPEIDDDLQAFYQPDSGARAVGILFTDSTGDIIYASSDIGGASVYASPGSS